MIQLGITRIAKKYNGVGQIYDSSDKYFKDLKEAKEWLKSEYGNCKRVPMFQDRADGSHQKVGYIYSYKAVDYEDGKEYHYVEQHWVAFNKVTPISV